MDQDLPKFASVDELAARYGVNRSSLYKWVKAGEYPRPIKLGPRFTRWRREDVQRYESTR